jgi:hypothetical protein
MTDKKIRYEDQFVAEVNVTGPLAGGGMNSVDIELAHTCEIFDAAGKYIPDPLPNVIRRGADFLEDKIANGEIGALDVFSFTVRKIAIRSLTQDIIGQAEEAAGIPRSL